MAPGKVIARLVFVGGSVLPGSGRHIDDLCPQQRILEIGLCVVGILSVRGNDQWHLDPVVVPLDLALKAPFLGDMDCRGAHSLMFRIRKHALGKLLSSNRRNRSGCRCLVCRGRRRNAWLRNPCGRCCRRTRSTGNRSARRTHRQPRGFFTAVRQCILMLFETRHNAAPSLLHSCTQSLRIISASRAKVSQRRLTTRLSTCKRTRGKCQTQQQARIGD